MTFKLTVDNTALIKIILHALKYPTTGVNGILIGEEKSSGPALAGSDSPDTSVHVFDCIPVSHSFITLTPLLELALAQVEAYTSTKTGSKLRIVGYYQCNEQMNDVELSGIARKAADRIHSLYPNSVALVLDALALKNILSVADNSPPLKLYWKDGVRGWNVAQKSSSSVELQCGTGSAIAGLIKQYMEEGRQQKLVDFEYHLEDLSADWLNPSLLV